MFSVSSEFLAALRSTSIRSSVSVTTTDGVVLSIADGSVSMDADRSTTRTCELTLTATPSMSLADVYDLVMSPAVEIEVRRGIWTGTEFEYVPLGVFSTDQASINRATSGTIRWSGSDRSKKIARARFIDPYQIAAGADLATAGTQLLQSRYVQTQTSFTNVTKTVTSSLVFDAGASSNPWENARSLFADYGFDLNFDGLGIARAVTVPDPSSATAVFDFGSDETNLVLGAESRGSLENVYNGVIASGEGSGVVTPVRAEAWDTNQLSPTYYLGSFGKVPLFYSSPLLTSVELCQTVADSMLSKMTGRLAQLAWPSIVNPALEPLDVVAVNVRGRQSTVVIDSLTIPLKAETAMTANAREVVTL